MAANQCTSLSHESVQLKKANHITIYIEVFHDHEYHGDRMQQ